MCVTLFDVLPLFCWAFLHFCLHLHCFCLWVTFSECKQTANTLQCTITGSQQLMINIPKNQAPYICSPKGLSYYTVCFDGSLTFDSSFAFQLKFYPPGRVAPDCHRARHFGEQKFSKLVDQPQEA